MNQYTGKCETMSDSTHDPCIQGFSVGFHLEYDAIAFKHKQKCRFPGKCSAGHKQLFTVISPPSIGRVHNNVSLVDFRHLINSN